MGLESVSASEDVISDLSCCETMLRSFVRPGVGWRRFSKDKNSRDYSFSSCEQYTDRQHLKCPDRSTCSIPRCKFIIQNKLRINSRETGQHLNSSQAELIHLKCSVHRLLLLLPLLIIVVVVVLRGLKKKNSKDNG